MTRSSDSREKRKADVRQRSKASGATARSRCAVFGCRLPTMRSEGRGLSGIKCRYHVQYEARHGSTWKKSYSAKHLAPYRATARKWIAANIQSKTVAQSLRQFDALLDNAGRSESALRLRGLKPQERSRIAFARIREAKVPSTRLLEVVLAVFMALKEDPVVDRSKDYRLCQLAKPCQRMASGTHKRWSTTEIHAYPKSSGLVLRYMGVKLEACAEWVIAAHLPEILAAKIGAFSKFQPAQATLLTTQPNPNFKRPQKRTSAAAFGGGERR